MKRQEKNRTATLLCVFVASALIGLVLGSLIFAGITAAADSLKAETQTYKVVMFTASWCGPCQRMKRNVLSKSSVDEAVDEAGFERHSNSKYSDSIQLLDADDNEELMDYYDITSLPTLMVMDADGIEVRRTVGYKSVSRTIDFILGN